MWVHSICRAIWVARGSAVAALAVSVFVLSAVAWLAPIQAPWTESGSGGVGLPDALVAGSLLRSAWRQIRNAADAAWPPARRRDGTLSGPAIGVPADGYATPEELPGLLTAVVRQTADIIFVTDTAGRIVYVNPAFEAVTGHRFAEVVGQTPRVLKSGQQNEDFYKSLWGTVTQGRVWKGNYPNRAKDGRLYFVQNTISPLRDGAGRVTHFLSVQKDVTDHHEMTQRLHQQERLELVGRMAEGVAHDFRNILQVVSGNAQLLRLQNPAESAQDEVKYILDAAGQGKELVERLLTFGRPSCVNSMPVQMDEIVGDFAKLLAPSIPSAVRAEWSVERDLPPLDIDPVELQQALMNLCLNAIQAMPHGGNLTIAVRRAALPGMVTTTGALLGGEYVDISVADTGGGMDSALVPHIFKPFFTTKGDRGGTGLGLATVHQIVSGMGGQIHVASRRGAGTRFDLYLPIPSSGSGTAQSPHAA
jgi:PAS domain S-box-containing protein